MHSIVFRSSSILLPPVTQVAVFLIDLIPIAGAAREVLAIFDMSTRQNCTTITPKPRAPFLSRSKPSPVAAENPTSVTNRNKWNLFRRKLEFCNLRSVAQSNFPVIVVVVVVGGHHIRTLTHSYTYRPEAWAGMEGMQ